MPTEFGDAIQSPAPIGKTEFGDAAATPAPADQEKGGYFHELYRQLIADPIKAFKADPVGTLTHLIGGAGGMITGTTPVPGPGGQIQVSGPTQMAGVADIAERGPAAIGAATTLAALPIAARYAGPLVSAGASKLAGAVPSNATADVVGLASPRVANAIRVANRIKRGVQAFQQAGEEAPAAAPTENTAMLDDIAKSQTGRAFSKLDPASQSTIRDIAQRINSGAAPEATGPAPNRPGPQLVLPRQFPPKNIRDIAQQELGQGNPPSGQDIIRGSSNIPLSQQGAAEAQRLGQATAGQFDKIYTSPLDRAQATSKAVAATNPQAGAPEPTEALTPWYLGGNEGRPTTEVLAKMQDLIQNHPDEVPAGRGPQSTKPGQSFNDFKDEFLSHVQNQVENYEPGQKILNATHYRDTRVLQAWAKAGASSDFKIDIPTMLEKGDVKPGDLLHLNPQTMEVKAVPDASEPGIYFARHGATAWNAENGSVNPAESVGAPGPAGGPVPQPPASRVFYRGTVPGSTQRIPDVYGGATTGKTFVARSPESARLYGSDIETITAKPEAKILYEGTDEFGKLWHKGYDKDLDLANQTRKGETQVDAVRTIADRAQAAGYDAVSFKRDSDIGTVILNEKAFNRGPQPPPAEVARLNAGAPPENPQGFFLRNYDLDRIARTLRTQLNKGTITKAQAQQIIESKAGIENLRDQLGLKGRYGPGMANYLKNKVLE